MMGKKVNMHIQFNQISVNAVDTAAGIFVGNNSQLAWSSHGKSNSGFGTVVGMNNLFQHNINVVNDQDIIDSPIDDRDTLLGKM